MKIGKTYLFLIVAAGCILTALLFLKLRNPEKTSRNVSELLKKQPLNHLGIIMDGNRRWAKQHGYKPWIGHQKGVEPLKEAISFCLEHNIKYLTLYTLSLENLKRPQEELNYLFDVLAKDLASKELDDLFKNGIRVRFIGDRSLFPQQLVPIINDIEQKTAGNTKLNLSLLFCYGGQQELIAAAQKLGQTKATQVSRDNFIASLWSGELPAIDLVIRTAGDHRLSNFMPFQAAYSELYFTPVLWPDFTKEHLADAILFFLKSKRNFGA